MDLSGINQIIGPTNQTISQNMTWLQQYQQNSASSTTTTPAANTNTAATSAVAGTAASDSQYLQAMMAQMQSMMAQMQQMQQQLNSQFGTTAYYSPTPAASTTLELPYNTGTVYGASNYSSLPGYNAVNSGSNTAWNSGTGLSANNNIALQQSGTSTAYQQIEGMIGATTTTASTSTASNITQLQNAVQYGQYSQADLTRAFQAALVQTTDSAQVGNLVQLLTQSEQNHLVSYNQTLNSGLLSQLSNGTDTALSTAISAQGLLNTDGKTTNTDLTRYLLSAANYDTNPYQQFFNNGSAANPKQQFAQNIIQQMVTASVGMTFSLTANPLGTNTNTQRLNSLLQLMGFQVGTDGKMTPSTTDPFKLTV